jgi:hypothetical protein
MNRAPAVVVFVLFSCVLAYGQDPRALVQRMVQHELQAHNDRSHWMYTDSMTDDSGTKVKEVVETHSGSLALVLSENGKPISNSKRMQEEAELREKAQDQAEIKKEQKASDDDARKATEMLKILPDAFEYSLVGADGATVHLHFRPDPNFDPPTREAKVFHSMAGDMFIDRKSERLVGLSGTLLSNVNFGFGILGKLEKGGTFQVRQKEVAPGHWELSLLDVHISGRALFFKSIEEQQHETRTDYHEVSDGLTPQDAVAMLVKMEEQPSRYAARK